MRKGAYNWIAAIWRVLAWGVTGALGVALMAGQASLQTIQADPGAVLEKLRPLLVIGFVIGALIAALVSLVLWIDARSPQQRLLKKYPWLQKI